MSDFFATLLEILPKEPEAVYAIVAATKGSTPQTAGAKAAFLPDGRVVGTIGGGCLEAEAQRRARDMRTEGQPVLFEIRLDAESAWDNGLICGGSAEVFLVPGIVRADEVLRRLRERQAKRERLVLVTVVASPAAPFPGRLSPGSLHLVSGNEVISSLPTPAGSQELLRTIVRQTLETPGVLLQDVSEAPGLRVLVEPILPRPTLLIVGAGHVGAALCRLAAWLDFEVVVVDDRASFANRQRLPDAARIVVGDPPVVVRDFPMTPDTYVVIVTRGHRHDAQALQECVNAPTAYVGMMGSRRKEELIFSRLLEEKICTRDRPAKIHAPIGLKIGALSVEELAVSIAAELVQVRSRIQPSRDPGEKRHEG